MESKILNPEVNVKVEPDEKSTSNWINTEGSCFLCLETTTHHRVVMPLRLLFGHLEINVLEVYFGITMSIPNKKWKNIRVDLCQSCGATHRRLLALLQANQLEQEKVQMEVNYLLEETNKIIFESYGKTKLVKKLCKKLSNNPKTPFTFDFVDYLRKMIANKCAMMRVGREPIVLLESGNIEAVVGNEAQSREGKGKESSEPRRSARRSKQEDFLEKRAAKTSGQKAKKTSTSKCQKTLKASKIRQEINPRKKSTKDSLTGMYKCIKCDKESKTNSTILHHYQAHHSNVKFSCEICNVAVFSRRYHLTRHQKTCQRNLEKRQDPK